MKKPMKIALAASAGLALALAAPLAASAHVTVTPSSTGAGAYSVLTFAIPHGCEASATTAIRITVPDSAASVTPTVNPGWDVAVQRDGDHVAAVTYTAHAPLPHELRDTFELSVRLPDGVIGDTITFPVLQTCVDGEIDWAGTESGAANPAPVVVLTESTGGNHGHDHDSHDTDAHEPDTVTASTEQPDVLARSFGIGGLVVGAVGIVIAAAALRRGKSAATEANE